jgi:hypothetical protein
MRVDRCRTGAGGGASSHGECSSYSTNIVSSGRNTSTTPRPRAALKRDGLRAGVNSDCGSIPHAAVSCSSCDKRAAVWSLWWAIQKGSGVLVHIRITRCMAAAPCRRRHYPQSSL